MARFILYTNAQKKRNALLLSYFLIVAGTFFLIFTIFTDGYQLPGIIDSIIAINLVWLGIRRLRKKNRDFFIDINEIAIEWVVDERLENTFLVEWRDIRWIKKENDGSITVFQDSSFSKNFSMEKFTKEDKTGILQLLQETAIKKQVRLINFSDVASAVA